MNSKPMIFFWIRAKKATRKHRLHRHMWKICVAYLKSIQSNPIQLNWIMFIDIAVNRSNLLLYISACRTYCCFFPLCFFFFFFKSQEAISIIAYWSCFYSTLNYFQRKNNIQITCFYCYLPMHVFVYTQMPKVPKMVESKTFWAHDRIRRWRWRWRWNEPNNVLECTVCSKRNKKLAAAKRGMYES